MNLVTVGIMGLNYLKYVFKLFQKISQGHRISDDPLLMWHLNFDTLFLDIRRLILHVFSQIRHMSVANLTNVHHITDDIVLQHVIKKPMLRMS